MAKKGETAHMCNMTACTSCGILALVAGILFLLQDIGVWNFWGLQWWTVAFIILGISSVWDLCR